MQEYLILVGSFGKMARRSFLLEHRSRLDYIRDLAYTAYNFTKYDTTKLRFLLNICEVLSLSCLLKSLSHRYY